MINLDSISPAKELICWESQFYTLWIADRKFALKLIDGLPLDVTETLWKQYCTRWEKYVRRSMNEKQANAKRDNGPSRSANIWLRKRVEMLRTAVAQLPVNLDLLRHDVAREKLARDMANQCYHILVSGADSAASTEAVLEEMRQIAERWDFGVSLPAQRISPIDGESTEEYQARADETLQLAQIARLIDQEWWERKLTTTYRRFCEHHRIILGKVRKGVSPYLSHFAANDYRSRQLASRQALAQMIAVNEITDEEIDLIQAVDASVSNPELRRTELMVRMRGFETIAQEQNLQSGFFTITCPSRFHAYTSWQNKRTKKSGVYENKKYLGTNPRHAQAYLNKYWQRLRAWMNRLEIPVMGFRVCEPHHDGTPHWHILLFFKPEHESALVWAFSEYFTRENRDELNVTDEELSQAGWHAQNHSGINIPLPKKWMRNVFNTAWELEPKARAKYFTDWNKQCSSAAKRVAKRIEARFKYVAMDPNKGSATGYIAKYIAKNIDGHKVGQDDETGAESTVTVNNVMGWASEWGIRQFQQIGGPSVTIWRELRRLEKDTEKQSRLLAKKEQRPRESDPMAWEEARKSKDAMETARLACIASRWDLYVEAMGGAFAMRSDRPVQLSYTYQENKIGEEVKKVKGVFSPLYCLMSRKDGWVIANKKTHSNKVAKEAAQTRHATEQGDSRAAWSSINNCTKGSKSDHFELKDHLLALLARSGRDVSQHGIEALMRGATVKTADDERIKLQKTESGYRIRVVDAESETLHTTGALKFNFKQGFSLAEFAAQPICDHPPKPKPQQQYWQARK